MYKHLRTCGHLIFIHNLGNQPDTLNSDKVPPDLYCKKEFFTLLVSNNTTVLDCAHKWNLVLYKEVSYIRRLAPSLNNGLKSSRELCLFS